MICVRRSTVQRAWRRARCRRGRRRAGASSWSRCRRAATLRHVQVLRDPAPDRIVAAREVVGVVRVQALHAARACRRRRRAGAGPAWSGGSAASRSRAYRSCAARSSSAIDRGFGRADAAGRLEPRRPAPTASRIDQPVAGRHRRAVVEQRRVADHDRLAVRRRARRRRTRRAARRPSSSVSDGDVGRPRVAAARRESRERARDRSGSRRGRGRGPAPGSRL